MIMRKNGYKYMIIVHYIICILGAIALIAWGASSPRISSDADQYEIECFHQGWTQHIGDASVPLDNIQDYTPVDIGESLVFTCTLPDIEEDWAFLFYSENKEVRCYVDDILIQDFTMQDGFSILKTPGSAWNQVDLTSDMSGKICTMIFNSPLGNYNYLCNIYLIENSYADNVRVMYLWEEMFSTLAIAVIMLVILFTAIVGQKAYRKRYLMSIVQYFLVVLLWLLAETNFYDMFFARPIISYLLGELSKRIIPLALLRLVRNSTNQIWHPKIFDFLSTLAWINLIAPFLIQFTLGISLLEMKAVNSFVVVIIHILIILVIAEKLVYFRRMKYEEYPCLLVPILVVSNGIDNMMLYYNKIYQPFFGVWTAAGALLFSLFTLIILTYINGRIADEKIEIECNCRKLENIALVKQLQAHFIFNTLNTISAYCKTDPEEADRAIKEFARYMRSYLHLITQDASISIHQEIDLVEHYLIIQKMRYGERINFSFDIDPFEFEIPPFTVYTLVENSIAHGINMKAEGGVVVITTKKQGDFAQIIIEDTGVGYDTSVPVKESSIGLRNTKRRLEIMKNGTIQIKSTIGVGTTIVIMIPIT